MFVGIASLRSFRDHNFRRKNSDDSTTIWGIQASYDHKHYLGNLLLFPIILLKKNSPHIIYPERERVCQYAVSQGPVLGNLKYLHFPRWCFCSKKRYKLINDDKNQNSLLLNFDDKQKIRFLELQNGKNSIKSHFSTVC